MFRYQEPKFFPCTRLADQSDGNELLIVEGESAASAVLAARNKEFQAVLSMQGKPMNTYRAKRERVESSPLFRRLIKQVGIELSDELAEPTLFDELHHQQRKRDEPGRFSRIILLFDPDADGIHCGALLMLFFLRWMKVLLEQGRVHVVRPPMFRVTFETPARMVQDRHVLSPIELDDLKRKLTAEGVHEIQARPIRGLASLEREVLFDSCLNPLTRHSHSVSVRLAEQAAEIFGTDLNVHSP